MTRDERQNDFIALFERNGGHGTLEATTAFGKTVVGLKVITRLRRKYPERKVLIVVPRIYLKDQWTEQLKTAGLEKNTTVEVINTAVTKRQEVDLLILDEIHRYAAETFFRVFETVTYRFILGLTATIKRLDKKHKLLTTHCPVIDTVTTVEALANDWIARYREFNLAIDVPDPDLDNYLSEEKKYAELMNVFLWDFGLMKRCCVSFKPTMTRIDGKQIFNGSACEETARKYGWTGNSPKEAYAALEARKSDVWGGNTFHTYTPKKIYLKAINCMRAMRKMKDFIYGHPAKLAMAAKICHEIPMKTITFSEIIRTADTLASMIGGEAASYHSKMGKAKLTAVTERLKKNEIRVICTARALDEGADFPDIQMGLRVSGSSSPTQHTQRRGRIVRKHDEKRAVMINLYIRSTKEVTWLTKAQGRLTDVTWVDSYEELREQLEEITI